MTKKETSDKDLTDAFFDGITKEREKLEKKVNRSGKIICLCVISVMVLFVIGVFAHIILKAPKEIVLLCDGIGMFLVMIGNFSGYYREGIIDGMRLHLLQQLEKEKEDEKCPDKN